MGKTVVAGVVLVFAMLFYLIGYSQLVNRNKPHVYKPEEVFVIECSKRGGNPTTKVGTDFSGDRNLDVNEFKCEGVTDVRN